MSPSTTHEPELYPILLEPVYKDYIWGGTRIPAIFDRAAQPGICAESWEVSDRPEGMSVVTNGKHAGTSLHELVLTLGRTLIGSGAEEETFPLLIKLIDAEQRLSVQVHPNDRTARKHGGEAKTEMWYVLDAAPGASVYAGLAPRVDKKAFEKALAEERLEEVLQKIPVATGQSIYIPGGRVHAIAEGCLLLEVQQNSNTTYRVYDWGRVGPDGRPRDLHVEQAFKVINWRDRETHPPEAEAMEGEGPNGWREVLSCPYFTLKRIDLKAEESVEHSGESFHVTFTLSGRARIRGNDVDVQAGPGVSCLLPAALHGYTLIPEEEGTTVMQISAGGGS